MFNRLKINSQLLYDKFASFFGEVEAIEQAQELREVTSQMIKTQAFAKKSAQMNCAAANHSDPIDRNHCYLVHVLPNQRMYVPGHEYLLCQRCEAKIFKGETTFGKLFLVLTQFQEHIRNGGLEFLRHENIHTPITPEMEALYQTPIEGLLPAL